MSFAGHTVYRMRKTIEDGYLDNPLQTPQYILCNLGANDCKNNDEPDYYLTGETWIVNYKYIIDALRAKWPGVTVYIAKPWRSMYTDRIALFSDCIDTIISDYPGGGVELGQDERTWLPLEGMSTDGIHYSAAGQIEAAAQWLAILTA